MIKLIAGTKDILPLEVEKWYFIENTVRDVFKRYNYAEIRTPIFEDTSLFSRSIGEETDIVSKEMYTFTDRGGQSITLKPEMTASVVRSFIEHSLGAQVSLNKLYYISPMFRQERPQAGRLRQFHQFGAEALGSYSPLLDAEMILIAYQIFNLLGLKDISVKINSLGKPDERENYKKILKEYLEPKIADLSEESKRRFNTNILRIFDSKDSRDNEIMNSAPALIDFLGEESRTHFNTVKAILSAQNVPFEVDPKLVRGLDYYTDTTFEVLSGKVGSQNALCGGGRYDSLIENLGGKPTPGVGFAAGIERLILALENEGVMNIEDNGIDFYLLRLGDDTDLVYKTAIALRNEGFKVDLDYLGRSAKAQMREANKSKADFVIFIGGDELKEGKVSIKNMKDSTQTLIELNKITEYAISIMRK